MDKMSREKSSKSSNDFLTKPSEAGNEQSMHS